MEEAMEKIDDGVKVGGHHLRDVRSADDQQVVASTQKGLPKISNKLNEMAKPYDIKIHVSTTKVMKVRRN